MLYCLVIWTLLLIVCCTVGMGALHLLRANAFHRFGDQLIASVWLGLVILSIVLLSISLVLPLSIGIGIAVAAGLCGLALSAQPVRRNLAVLKSNLETKMAVVYLTIALLLSVLATRPVSWLDTGLYHYNLIQWLHQYGTVPGLALLLANFGFTSSWFAFAAPLNPELLDSRATAIIGSLILLVALLQIWISFGCIAQRRAQISDWFLGFFSFVLLLCTLGSPHLLEIAISPSPDLPVAFLAGVIPWTILVITNASSTAAPAPTTTPVTVIKKHDVDSSLVTLILAIGAVTIKLVALPLLMMSGLFYLVHNHRSYRRLIDGLATVILLLSPFLVVQFLTSGCPLYPSTAFCLNTDWGIPTETGWSVAQQTHNWTSWYQPDNSAPLTFLAALLRWLSDNRGNQVMTLIAVISLAAVVILVSWCRQQSYRGYGWVIATQIIGILFFLKTSPLLRFALPYLILIPALWAAVYCGLKLKYLSPTSQPIKFLSRSNLSRFNIILPLFVAVLIASIFAASASPLYLVLPPPLKKVPVTQKQSNDFTYLSPQGTEVCWNTAIPCAFEIPADVQLRNATQGVAGGFIHKQ